MDREQYRKLLTDDRWQIVRKQVLKRDGYICKHCHKGDCPLSVHHTFYIEGAAPWEVPISSLVSLCSECHAKAHEGRLISSFVRKRSKPRCTNKKGTAKYRPPGEQKRWIEGKGLIPVSKDMN